MARIIGERIMLREYQESDFEHMRSWVNDGSITDNLSDAFLYPHSELGTREFLDSMLKGKEKGFVIAHKDDGSYIGQVDLINISWKNRYAELGIVLGNKDEHGKGYGSEALLLLQDFVFNSLNLHRLQLIVHDYNQAAINCYKKVGFVEEGRKREVFYKDGKYSDYIQMGILRREYLKKKEGR